MLKLAADTQDGNLLPPSRVSDVPGHAHAEQTPDGRPEAAAPPQPALRADSKGLHGTGKAPAIAALSKDILPELPQARAAPSSPDPPKQAEAKAAMGCSHSPLQMDKPASQRPEQLEPAMSKRLGSADRFSSEPDAAEQQTPLLASPSAAEAPTAPEAPAESHGRPATSSLIPSANQSQSETQQPQTDGVEMTNLAEASAAAVSDQAAPQKTTALQQPLLGVSSLTPLPPPVLSPTRALPDSLQAAQKSPLRPLPGEGLNGLLGRTAVTLPPPLASPITAQGQAAPLHQTSSSAPALALRAASDGIPLPAQASHVPAQASPLPAQASPLPAQATQLPAPLPAQASPRLAEASPLPGASASLQTAAGDNGAEPQLAVALQIPSTAAVISASAATADASRADHDTGVTEAGAPGTQDSGVAVDVQGNVSQPVQIATDGELLEVLCALSCWLLPSGVKSWLQDAWMHRVRTTSPLPARKSLYCS